MSDKIPELIAYGLLGLILAIAPLFAAGRLMPGGTGGGDKSSRATYQASAAAPIWHSLIALALLVALVRFVTPVLSPLYLISFLVLAIVVAACELERVGEALEAVAGMALAWVVGGTLIWWRRHKEGVDLSDGEVVAYFALLLIVAFGMLGRRSVRPAGDAGRRLIFGSFAAITLYLSFQLGLMASIGPLSTLWHHWGAYIGPSEAVLAGARLFHDIPVQYGAGPTALIALFCSRLGCWEGAYWVFSLATAANGLMFGALAFFLWPANRARNALLLPLCVLASQFWVAYPPSVAAAMITPSVSGMRFVWALAMAAWLLFAEPTYRWRSHGAAVIWLAGMFWSPEAAFYVTAIWWPIHLFDRSAQIPFRIVAIGRAFLELSALLIGAVSLFVVFYRAHYGVYPIWRYMFAYAVYPPGPIPIDWHGSVWFFLATIGVSVVCSWWRWARVRERLVFRRSLVLQLMAFAAASYYLGRSHDNNILNLMPFMVLLWLDVLSTSVSLFARHAAAFSLASICAWAVVFGWLDWGKTVSAGRLLDFNYAATFRALDYHREDTVVDLAKRAGMPSAQPFREAAQLMDRIRARGETFEVLDAMLDIHPIYPGNVWNALHGPANFPYIPSVLRREFLRNSAARFDRPGWVIVDKSFDAASWLDDFSTAYRAGERMDLGGYYAQRFIPRSSATLGVSPGGASH